MNKTIEDVFGIVESISTCNTFSYLPVTYNFHILNAIIKHSGWLDNLDENAPQKFEERIKKLLDLETDTKKLHPYDKAIMVYLVILSIIDKIKLKNVLFYLYDNYKKYPNLYTVWFAYTDLIIIKKEK